MQRHLDAFRMRQPALPIDMRQRGAQKVLSRVGDSGHQGTPKRSGFEDDRGSGRARSPFLAIAGQGYSKCLVAHRRTTPFGHTMLPSSLPGTGSVLLFLPVTAGAVQWAAPAGLRAAERRRGASAH